MRIQVTQEHIDLGTPNDAFSCPIALASQAAGVKDPCVSGSIMWTDGAVLHELITPPEVLDFVDRFDHGLPVEPFSFDLDVTP